MPFEKASRLLAKAYLHYSDNHSKLVRLKEDKNIFAFLNSSSLEQFSPYTSLKVRLHWHDFADDFALSLHVY